MKTNLKIILLVAFVMAIGSNVFGQNWFNKRYNSSYTELSASVCTFENYSWVFGTRLTDTHSILYLIKIDQLGNKIDSTIIQHPYKHYFTGWAGFSKITSDSGMIMAGAVLDTSGYSDVLLIKFNSNGDTLWTKQYDIVPNETAFDVIETSDKGFAIVGSSEEDTIAGTMVARIIKTDSLGNFEWTQIYIEDNLALGTFIIQNPDKGFCIGGATSYGNPPSVRYPYVIKTDSLGVLQWIHKYSSEFDTNVNACVINTSDGNLAIASGYSPINNWPSDFKGYLYVAKIDINNGDTIWTRKFGKAIEYGQILFSITELSDGSLVSAGYTFENGFQKQFAVLLKTSSNGDSLWLRYYTAENLPADSSESYFFHVQETYDNGLIACGWMYYQGSQNFLAIKTDANGCLDLSCVNDVEELEEDDFRLSIYPNPAEDDVSIDLPIMHNTGILQIYSLQGQLVKSASITTGGTQSFSIADMPNGIYNLVVYSSTNKLLGREKLVVVH